MKKLLLPLLLTLWVIPIFSQETLFTTEVPPTRALVVGISTYQNPKIPKLNYAHKDAQAFANFLSSSGWVEDARNIHLLTNENATSGNLVKEFGWLLKESKKGDRAIIYFSGHGDKERLTSSGLGYLLTYNSPPNNFMGGGAFNLRDLQTIVNDLSANDVEVVLIFDACKSGEGNKPNDGASAVTANLQQRFSNEIKLLSCQSNELSKEGPHWGDGRGVFSYYLIEGLIGPADKNGNGEITVVEIENYLEEKVSQAVKQQLPFAVGDKNKVLAYVSTDAANRPTNPSNTSPIEENVGTRGLDQPSADADPEVQKLQSAFASAVEAGKLLQPMGDCANVHYRKLMNKESFSESEKDELTYTFVAALTDGSQEVYNKYVQADSAQLANYYHSDPKFSLYPAYLGRACELLGEDHYLYKTFKLRQLNFETLVERVKFFELGKTDKAQEKLADQQKKVDVYLESLSEEYEYLTEEPSHYYDRAVLAMERGDYEEAIAQAEKTIELSPYWALPYSLLGSAYLFGIGDMVKAEEAFRKALTHAELEQKPYFLFDLSQALYVQEKYDDCIPLLEEATTLAPEYAEAWNWLGINYRLTQQFDQSRAAYQKAVELEPRNANYHYELGAQYYDTGDYANALVQYQLCMYLEEDPDIWYYQTADQVYEWIVNNTNEQPLEEYELEAMLGEDGEWEIPLDEFGNPDTEKLFVLGEEAYLNGEYQEAETYLLTLLDWDESYGGAFFYLGMIYNETYRMEEAEMVLSYAAEAFTEVEDMAVFKCALGYTYYLQDRLDEAELSVLEGLELSPDFTDGYSLLSMIYEMQGEEQKATEAMDKYKELGGEFIIKF